MIKLFVKTLLAGCLVFPLTLSASPDLIASYSDLENQLDMPQGRGKLSITVESFAGMNVKRASCKVGRAEIWLGARRLASMPANDADVVDEGKRRLFVFPLIELEAGYYFITIRLYGPGTLSARQKWNGITFQVGIHPQKVSRVHKTIPVFLW
jgi:hypothetical protein